MTGIIERWHSFDSRQLNHYRWTTNEGVQGSVTLQNMTSIIPDPSPEELTGWYKMGVSFEELWLTYEVGGYNTTVEVKEKCQWIVDTFVPKVEAKLWMDKKKAVIVEFSDGCIGRFIPFAHITALKIEPGFDVVKETLDHNIRPVRDKSLHPELNLQLDCIPPLFPCSFPFEDVETIFKEGKIYKTNEIGGGCWFEISRFFHCITAIREYRKVYFPECEPEAVNLTQYRDDSRGYTYLKALQTARDLL